MKKMKNRNWIAWNTIIALLLMAIVIPEFATSILAGIFIALLSIVAAFFIVMILGRFLDYIEKRPVLYVLVMLILGLYGIYLLWTRVMSHW